MKNRIRKSLFAMLTFSFLFLGVDCKDDPPVIPPVTPPDTTSHDFTWTTYTFSGTGGSSYFKDVAIINDSDIWAVGAIYTSPETTYNAAHWDGGEWELRKIPFVGSCSAVMYPPLQAIWAFMDDNILVTNGGSIVRFSGTNAEMDCRMNSLLTGAINKIFAVTPQNIYIVGNAGTIVYYNGSVWSKQESGTTIDLRDVWGTPDGKTVWACGESIDNSKSILLRYENNQWKTVWERNGGNSVLPYGYNVGSIWSKNQTTYITTSYGVFQIKDTVSTRMENNFSTYSRALRGNEEYDMFTVGEGGRAWHYNGVDWKQLFENSNYFLIGSNLKSNIAIAVGTDFSIEFGAGLIYVGRR